MYRPIFLAFLLVCLAFAAGANPIILPFVEQIEFSIPGEASLVLVPDGSGSALGEARLITGEQVDATIRIRLVDDGNDPMAGVPVEEIWLVFEVYPGNAVGCTNHPYYDGGMFFPDGESDADGWMEWTLPLQGGGWSEGPVRIFIYGDIAFRPGFVPVEPLTLRVNSPDIDGDLAVDLTDITLFMQDFGGVYHYRSDLCWDGQLNLSDITLFAQGIGALCP